MGLLAKLKFLRGSSLDIFGRTEERRIERELILEYCAVIEEVLVRLDAHSYSVGLKLAQLPEQILGFGHVKAALVERARAAQRELLVELKTHTTSSN